MLIKRLFLLSGFIFCLNVFYGQTLLPTSGTAARSNSSVIPEDYNFSVRGNLYIPRFVDTSQANEYQKMDTCGRIIFNYATNSIQVRKCNPKRWEDVGSSGIADSSFVSFITGSNKQLYGNRYVYDNTTVMDNTPTATAVIDASGVLYSGGTYNLSNFTTFADSIASHWQTISGTFVLLEKSDTSFGPCFAFQTKGNGASQYIQFSTADTGLYITETLGPVLSPANSTNRGVTTFFAEVGDSIGFFIERKGYRGTATFNNKTRNGDPSVLELTNVQTNVAQFNIHTLGGQFKILNDLKITYHEVKNPEIAFVGESIMSGLTANSLAKTWQSIATTDINGGANDYSAGATRTIDGTYLLADLTRNLPKRLVYGLSLNDSNGGVDTATSKNRVLTLIIPLKNLGVEIIIFKAIAQNLTNVTNHNLMLQNLADSLGLRTIDGFGLTVNPAGGTGLNPLYDYDNIHLNDAGNLVVGEGVKEKLRQFGVPYNTSPLNIPYLPLSTDRWDFEVTQDATNGNIGRRISGTNPGYLWARTRVNDAKVFQEANGNFHGDFWFTSIRFGLTPQGGTMKLDNTGIDATVGRFSSLLTVGTGANRVDVQTGSFTIAGKPIFLSGGIPITGSSQPISLIRSIPQNGGKVGLRLQASTAGGGVIQSDFLHVVILNEADTMLTANNRGGIKTKGINSYYGDSSATILANPRNIPDVGTVQQLLTNMSGSGTLSAGSAVVNNTSVTATSKIFIQYTNCSNCGSTYISNKSAGVSFTVTSTNVSDGSTFDYFIVN